jgi:hypothetical protein
MLILGDTAITWKLDGTAQQGSSNSPTIQSMMNVLMVSFSMNSKFPQSLLKSNSCKNLFLLNIKKFHSNSFTFISTNQINPILFKSAGNSLLRSSSSKSLLQGNSLTTSKRHFSSNDGNSHDYYHIPGNLIFDSGMMFHYRAVPLGFMLVVFPSIILGVYYLNFVEVEEAADIAPNTLKTVILENKLLISAAGLAFPLLATLCISLVNRRIIREISLLPNRKVRFTTVGTFKSSRKIYDLDLIMPSYAEAGSVMNGFYRLSVLNRDNNIKKPFKYLIFPFPNKVLPHKIEQLLQLLRNNRFSDRDLKQ